MRRFHERVPGMFTGALATIFAGALAVAGGTGVVLVEDGEPRSTIVIARDAGAKVETAAAELARAIEKISGAKLPIVKVGEGETGGAEGDAGRGADGLRGIGPGGAGPRGALILVGRSSLTAGIEIPSGLTSARREVGYLIQADAGTGAGADAGTGAGAKAGTDAGTGVGPKSGTDAGTGTSPDAASDGARLILAGNDEGPYHGTEYAVYDFLRSLGVRWFMPGEYGEVMPRLPSIAVEPRVVRARPDFVMRNWWLHVRPPLAEEERRWKLRNKMNPDQMFAIPGDSSARSILPASTYFAEHPEYFALSADGTRNPHLPNLTHPKAVEIAAGVIVENLRRSAGATSYGFAPDDGLPRDYSPETAKLNSGFVELGGRPGVPGEVSTSQEWFRFANAVAAEVRRELPDAYIATNGYANRDIPPEGMDLDDHLVVMFAAIWSCTLHAYDDPHCWQKVRQGEMLRRWCELCPNVWIYGYNYGMLVSALTPIPETRKLRRDFPLMKRWGVMGFWDENRNVWAECGIASRYLRAQLEWDADSDVEEILADFYAKWYGEAAPHLRAYHDALEDAIETASVHGHEDRVLPEVYTPELVGRLRPLIARAEEAAGGAKETARARTHVRADRLIHDHLERYVELSAAEAEGDYAVAAGRARAMLAIRKELHAIDPFYIWDDEDGYHTGVWYWKVSDRERYYQGLRDLTSGKAGDLVALFPKEAAFRTDPHDDGLFARWYLPGPVVSARLGTGDGDGGWCEILTTRPFYAQGFQDAAGHPFVGTVWYRLEADVPSWAAGRKVILYAPVVETEAWCWVNGEYVGHRPYREAYERPSPIELDVTRAIRPGERNLVAIRVSTSLALAQAASGLLSRVILYSPKASSTPASGAGPGSESPSRPPGPTCRLAPLHAGICTLGADHVLGDDHGADERIPFALLAFLVEGPAGEKALVDLGPMTLEYTNAMFRRYGFFRDLGEGVPEDRRHPDDIVQPHGNVFRQIEARGVAPSEIGHIVFTHIHADHHGMDDATDGGAAERFPNAVLHVSGIGWDENLARRVDGRWGSYVDFAFGDFLLRREGEGKVRFADDAGIFPGLRTLYLGGHAPCSQAVVVETPEGTAIITSDEVYRYDLLERALLPRLHTTPTRYREAVERLVSLAESTGGILLPVHDPAVWEAHAEHGARGWLAALRLLSDRAIRGYREAGGIPQR